MCVCGRPMTQLSDDVLTIFAPSSCHPRVHRGKELTQHGAQAEVLSGGDAAWETATVLCIHA